MNFESELYPIRMFPLYSFGPNLSKKKKDTALNRNLSATGRNFSMRSMSSTGIESREEGGFALAAIDRRASSLYFSYSYKLRSGEMMISGEGEEKEGGGGR